MELTIAGTGSGREDITLGTADALMRADAVVLKTEKSRAAEYLRETGIVFVSLDYVFEKSRNFDTLNENLAREVLKIGREKNAERIVYLVDGCAGGDVSAKILLRKVKNARVIGGVTKQFAGALAGPCARMDISAYELSEGRATSLPLLVYDLDSRERASDVKLILMDRYGEECECVFYDGAAETAMPVYELDRQDGYGIYSAVYVPEQEFLTKDRYDMDDVVSLIKMLRAENGCPWDRAQTHESIRQNLLEECYELADAIDRGDDDNMREETGDVLLQAVFHAVIAEERGAYNLGDAVTELCKKLIFRHTHIFSKDKAADAAEALSVWEKNKNAEKNYKTAGETLEAVPSGMPQLMRAEKVKKRSAKVNFDFGSLDETLAKVREECDELKAAELKGDGVNAREECGDLLLAAACAVSQTGNKPEQCLKESIDKYIRRFCKMERLILNDGREPKSLTAEEYDGYWKKAKEPEDR